jgi:hypothetical protein
LWSSPSTLVVGGIDHQIKTFDVESGKMVDNILTQNKVPTAMDGSENMILTG